MRTRISAPAFTISILLCWAPLVLSQSWTEQKPQTSPPARTGHTMAYDSGHSETVLFGGSDSSGNSLADTWLWDGTNWTQPQSQGPSGRASHGTAYDSNHQQTVLFGGLSITNGLLNDTWVWDGSSWSQMNPANSPSPQAGRYAHGMAYDSGHHQVVLFGGQSEKVEDLNDTWLWDGTNWTQASPSTMPPARYLTAAAYDSQHGQTVLFGGQNAGGTIFGDTWVWDGTNWTQESQQAGPPPRHGHVMAFDSTHGQVVLFGGIASDGSTLLSDTWTWDGSKWTQQSPQTKPAGRNAAGSTFDSTKGVVVMFGGFDGSYANDTWTWMGAAAAAGPVVKAVVNGASFVGGGVVPGEIATAFGTNLTSGNGINLTSSLPLPTTFLTDSLTVNT